ncbi:hypothetical protein U1Q18_014308 [Sarracenia purpurea var. burkii]
MSEKECNHHKSKQRKLLRRACAGLLIFNFILLVVILLIWAILQPKKPQFILQDATIYAFNLSYPNTLTSAIQVTISATNPNNQISVYYNNLNVFATYQKQQITYFTTIPPTYQGQNDVNVWSPFIVGTNVPVASYNGVALSQDEADGRVILLININGQVRWKVGTYITGDYHLHVNYPALITFGSQTTGIIVGNAIKYQLVQSCSVNV